MPLAVLKNRALVGAPCVLQNSMLETKWLWCLLIRLVNDAKALTFWMLPSCAFPLTKVGLYASATIDRVASETHEFDPYTVGCYAVGCNVVARLPLHMQLATDIRMLGNYGYSDTQMHKKELVWNARLTKSLMKGRLQLMLDGYDLLRQISNRHYIINAQGRLEQYTNAIPRYVMMHAAFKINKNPKKK